MLNKENNAVECRSICWVSLYVCASREMLSCIHMCKLCSIFVCVIPLQLLQYSCTSSFDFRGMLPLLGRSISKVGCVDVLIYREDDYRTALNRFFNPVFGSPSPSRLSGICAWSTVLGAAVRPPKRLSVSCFTHSFCSGIQRCLFTRQYSFM